MWLCCAAVTGLLFLAVSNAQSQTADSTQTSNTAKAAEEPAELTTQDQPTTFKVNVRLILVRAVVSDAAGKSVGNLKKEDFQIFDNHKLQVISHFAAEQANPKTEIQATNQPSHTEPEEPVNPPSLADRYIAYVFDDLHVQSPDLVSVREAAERHLTSLPPSDRAAIFTTSGQGNLDFTDDRSRLHDAISRVMPRSTLNTGVKLCPDIDYYMADLIVNKNDQHAIEVATKDALGCAYNGDTRLRDAAEQLAKGTARQVLDAGRAESEMSLKALRDVVRRMAAMPGQRTVVLVSPGIYTADQQQGQIEVEERALKSNVIISTLDARGLYTIVPGEVPADRWQYVREGALAQQQLLAELADATGGTFFHNSNDLEAGFNRVAAVPEFYYVLGFSPLTLKYDGRFHLLEVKVKGLKALTIQARKGYYAPKQASDPAEAAKEEIEDAVFSQEELQELPVELHTRFFKPTDFDAKLTVLAHVDVRQIHFEKLDGRNHNDLAVVSAVFDRSGKYVAANQTLLNMRLRDETLRNKLNSGITLKSDFDVKPGIYQVRLVVRDDEGHVAARTGVVEIP